MAFILLMHQKLQSPLIPQADILQQIFNVGRMKIVDRSSKFPAWRAFTEWPFAKCHEPAYLASSHEPAIPSSAILPFFLQAPAETSPPPTRFTTANPLNKLRNRNRLQVHPKTTTRSPVSLAPRRSPLLPRRKVTEAPVAQTSEEEVSEEPESSSETESTEAISAETSTAASTKHEETRGLGGLLAPRRRLTPRRPGQIISRE